MDAKKMKDGKCLGYAWYLNFVKFDDSFLARLFEEKKLSYCGHSGVSVWVG